MSEKFAAVLIDAGTGNLRSVQKALAHALSCGRPTVVDVVTSDRYTFRDVTSPLAAYP